ncbi:Competence protein CoiA-like family protein [Rhizobiales bacterium GAS191]|nr:Competence protein CoiA-like family protein [Rhizobiales bacterium GAS191]
MLVAHHQDGIRVEASTALKGHIFVCPGCGDPVILKKGEIVVHHFAHYPGSVCEYGTGETLAHMTAKFEMAASLRRRGWHTEVEYVPPGNPNRRIDVITWPPKLFNRGFVFEFQNTSISAKEMFQRADDYAALGYVQSWIPVWKPERLKKVDHQPFPRYSVPQFEHWVQGFNLGHGLWYFDHKAVEFRYAKLTDYWLWADDAAEGWDGRYHATGDSYQYISKRWRTFEHVMSCKPDDLQFRVQKRFGHTQDKYRWPECARGVICIDNVLGLQF